MRRAVIVHGMPSEEEYLDPNQDSPSNAHWLPWLQSQLCSHGVLAQTPEMPLPYRPDLIKWRKEFAGLSVGPETVLVGHSFGAGFLLSWLSQSEITVRKLVLVAPWLDMKGDYKNLFQFEIDFSLVRKAEKGIEVVYSNDDEASIQNTVNLLKDQLPAARYHEFHDYGHFCLGDMRTRQFPELLALCM